VAWSGSLLSAARLIVAFRSRESVPRKRTFAEQKATLDKVQGQNRLELVGRNQNAYSKYVLACAANPRTDLVLIISA